MGRLGGSERRGLDSSAGEQAEGNRAGTYAVPVGAPEGLVDRVLITLSGARQLIVLILLAIAFMTFISGKPVDGLLMLLAAAALSWDSGLRARQVAAAQQVASATHARSAAADQADSGEITRASGYGSADAALEGSVGGYPAWRPRAGRPRARVIGLGLAGVPTYALIVGSFGRYSWPATAGVVGLGSAVVVVGWGGPIRQREIPGQLPRTGVIIWTALLVFGGLWELGALLGQPNITTSSYAHPTISTLTDPLLAFSVGRATALVIWIAAGWWLVER